MNFDPLEVVKAFDAPASREVSSNVRGGHIAKQLGAMEMKYGAVLVAAENYEVKRRLVFDQSVADEHFYVCAVSVEQIRKLTLTSSYPRAIRLSSSRLLTLIPI